jgi:hypothetical protein
MARNQYPGPCRDCAASVPAGEGFFEKQHNGPGPKWSVRCMSCVIVGKLARNERIESLPLGQREWWRGLPKDRQAELSHAANQKARAANQPGDGA